MTGQRLIGVDTVKPFGIIKNSSIILTFQIGRSDVAFSGRRSV